MVQLEINPFFQQKFLAEKFQNLGITVQTYSTLAAGERMYEPRWESDYWSIAVDTGRKLNVHKKFTRRARHFLNVLCTFNLRPMSAGLVILLLVLLNY